MIHVQHACMRKIVDIAHAKRTNEVRKEKGKRKKTLQNVQILDNVKSYKECVFFTCMEFLFKEDTVHQKFPIST